MSFLLNLKKIHTYTLFYKNALDFLKLRYSSRFFGSEPKYILKLFLSLTTNIPLGFEKPELNSTPLCGEIEIFPKRDWFFKKKFGYLK